MARLPSRPARLVAALAVVATVLAAVVAAQSGPVLVVERVDNGQAVVTAPVENGSTVGLEYTHSVEKSRVYDGYTVRDGQLVMTRMEFESYGWGLPADANVTNENGTLVYDPPGVYETITVQPGSIADHRLHVDNRTYDLYARSDGRAVRISVQHRSPLDSLL
jgi:hypothetical protein